MTETSEPSGSQAPKRAGLLAFWTTLPGIFTGAAALITAVAGLVAIFYTHNDNGSSKSGSKPASATTAAHSSAAHGTAAKGSTTSPPASQSGPTAAVIAHGLVILRRMDAADLERGLIENAAGTDISFGPESTPYLHASGDTFLAPLSAPPSKSACRNALNTRHDAFEALPNLGTRVICVSTDEGHIAVVQVIRMPGVGSNTLTLAYRVWR